MREGRVLSRNSPAMPSRMNRSCQRHTEVLLLPVRGVTSTVPRPAPVREQVFDAEKYLGTPPDQIEKKLVPGGHIGLFTWSRTLQEAWPGIATCSAAKR